MANYYTQNPTGSFKANSDWQAIDKSKADVIYRKSKNYSNNPFTIIQDNREKQQLLAFSNIIEFYENCQKLFFIHRKKVKEINLYDFRTYDKDYYFIQQNDTGYALLSCKSVLIILRRYNYEEDYEYSIIEFEATNLNSEQIHLLYLESLEEQKLEDENKAKLALLKEQELIKQSKLIFEEKITNYLKAVESFKLELENKDIEFYSEYFNQENQYPIFRFMIKIPPVSNKSNKPRVKIVNFNSKTNKFEFHIPIGHEKDPFYQQSVIYIDKFKSILSQSKE